jgi:hypothetical protein
MEVLKVKVGFKKLSSGSIPGSPTCPFPRADIGLKWKKACINLFITYFNIELKRTKLSFSIINV